MGRAIGGRVSGRRMVRGGVRRNLFDVFDVFDD
jgi:hypothetical protein